MQLKKLETELEKLIHNENNNEQQVNRIEQLKLDLENWYDQEAKKSAFRTKINWIRQGEKNTKYFMGLEKQKGYNQ